MKKNLLILLLILFISGCGNKENASVVSCKYNQSEGDVNVVVEMLFKKDVSKDEINNGQLIMSYNFSGAFDEESKKNMSTLISNMFDGVCDNLENVYKDCKLNIDGSNVDVVMDFDLDVLENTSGGTFKKTMSVNQVKSYILSENKIEGLVCTIE